MTGDDGSIERSDNDEVVTRRRLLFGGGAALATVGGGRALYNTRLGYGELGMGTNLLEQDLPPLLTERLSTEYDETIDGTPVRFEESTITVGSDEARLSLDDDDRSDAARLDRAAGLDGRLEELFVDLSAFRAGEYAFEFSQPDAFFERTEGADLRPEFVASIRVGRDRTVDPDLVERFAGVDPAEVPELVEGLVGGFREHTNYDVPRYLAGSIEDNVIFEAHDLRQYFEDDVDFESLLEADGTGIFCWELVFRSIEALQAVAPFEQSIPTAACYVSDRRHKHAFTGVISAIRDDGELRLPMTFLDYTHSTMYDDARITPITGDGLAAYDDGHRADDIYHF